MAYTDAGLGILTKRQGVDRIVWYMCQRERGVLWDVLRDGV